MSCNWNSLTLGDIANPGDGFIDGPFGSNLPAKNYTKHGVPIIRGSNLSLGISSLKDNNYVFICEDDAIRLKRSECLVGDIIFTKKGTLGQTGFITDNLKFNRFILSSNQMRLRVDTTKAVPEFVYYCLSSRLSISKIKNDSEHTGVPKINLKYLRQFPINLPSLRQQEAIVLIIKSLNDKLYLNTQTNQTLEAMAQALFKSWFVDFDPVKAKMRGEQPDGMDTTTVALFPDKLVESELGLIPEGWKVDKIKNFGTIVCGKTPSKKNESFYNGDVPFIKIPDTHGKVYITKTVDSLSKDGDLSQLKKRIPKNSVCVSCIATVGQVVITSEDCHTNQQINSIVPESAVYTPYIYLKMLSLKQQFKDLASGGSATLNMNTSTFSNIELIKPSDQCLIAFYEATSGLFKKILHNDYENTTLENLRDTLLSKLLSGELNISTIENKSHKTIDTVP